MRVVVCGGRTYGERRVADREPGWREDLLRSSKERRDLRAVLCEHAITELCSGGAAGADSLAIRWANLRAVKCRVFLADWGAHGKAAGPIRNQQMLDEFKPDAVIAFPGGKGTADMVKKARSAGVRVIEVQR